MSKQFSGRKTVRLWVASMAMACGVSPVQAMEHPIQSSQDESSTDLKAISAGSTLTLTASTSRTVVPAALTLTATVGGTALKGNVVFKSGGSAIAVAPINKAAATVVVTLPAAIHSLTAVFSEGGGNVVSAPNVVVVDNPLGCN